MYFTMDEITRELRQGSNFQNEVAGAYTTIVFTQYQPGTASRYKYKYVLNNNNAIEKFEIDTKDTLSIADDTSTSLGLMTNSNIKITGLKFEIIGSGKYIDGDRQQPSIKMIVRGETKEKPFANFQLENYVTQRGAGE